MELLSSVCEDFYVVGNEVFATLTIKVKAPTKFTFEEDSHQPEGQSSQRELDNKL